MVDEPEVVDSSRVVGKDDGGRRKRAFGDRLRALRMERNMSQEALGHRAGLSPNYVGDVERGTRNLGLENICALAEALGISPREFFA